MILAASIGSAARRFRVVGRTRRDRNERGVVAVEFALILPILVLMLFGIIEFGRAYSAKVRLTHAAHEAVRVVALNTGDPAATAAAAANLPVTVTIVSGCPSGIVGDAEITVTHEMDLAIPLMPAQHLVLEESARMRCGVGS